MPKIKMKSNSGAKKRFRFTAKGKVRFKKAYHRHILTKKSTKHKRGMRRMRLLPTVDVGHIRRMLPYGGC
jgi:large subunit ribosomal protein L35